MAETPSNGTSRQFSSQSSLDKAIWGVCDILRRSNCAGAMQYVPELTWILFLRILDEREETEEREARAVGSDFRCSLEAPYRWRDWAAPDAAKRNALQEGSQSAFYNFVNTDLIPHLKRLRDHPNATSRQKVMSEIMSGVDRTRIDTERNLCDVLDKVDEIRAGRIDDTHVFALSQIYEGLLLKMGEKGNDGGQFFTPREIIRALVEVVAPTVGETVYDPCCGTGGFLAQAYEFMRTRLGERATGEQIESLKQRTFYGREKENLIYPIALANLVLHGIDQPHIWHGNSLTQEEIYSGLYQNAPGQFDVILTNPPFGGKEGGAAQTRFAYKTKATQVLFLQDVIAGLKSGGRCGIVLDEGVLFQTNQAAFVQTKRRLLDTCDLWCIVSLPAGLFTAAGAGVKTNLLFFNKGKTTKEIWYYDLSDVKVGKKKPFTRERLKDFFSLLPTRGESERSWTIDIAARRRAATVEANKLRSTAEKPKADLEKAEGELSSLKAAKAAAARLVEIKTRISGIEKEIRDIHSKAQSVEDAAFDLKAVNPNASVDEDTRTPRELMEFVEMKNHEVQDILTRLKVML